MSRSADYRPVPFNPSSSRFLVAGLLLIMLIVAAYWRALNSDFINMDDPPYVADNGIVQKGLTGEGLRWAFTTTYQANWHPLTWLSHMLDCQLYGTNPTGHHLSNILLHTANTILLLLVLTRMSGALWRSAFVAAVFAIHPLHVESVAWVAERKDLLCTLGWMLALLSYLRYVEKPSIGRYAALSVTLALGLMAKPMLVTFPFVLLLLDYWPLRRLVAERGNKPDRAVAWKRLSALVWEKVPLFLLSALSSLVTMWAQSRGGALASLKDLPYTIRFENGLVSYIRYIEKFFWPSGLAPFYPHPGSNLPEWQAGTAGVLLILATLGALKIGKRKAYVPTGWFWYLGTLVPVIGVVQVGSQAMADRYTYVPLIGLAIIIAWGVTELWPHRRTGDYSSKGERSKPVAAFAALLVLGLTAATFRQVGYWRNSEILFKHALDVTEGSYIVYANLGLALAKEGKESEAIGQYQKALNLKPDCTDALNNLAWILATSRINEHRDGAEAVRLASQACNLTGYGDPTFLDTLAAAYAEVGRYGEAIQTERKALDLSFKQGEPKQGEPPSALEERLRLYQSHSPYRNLATLTVR